MDTKNGSMVLFVTARRVIWGEKMCRRQSNDLVLSLFCN